MSIPDELMVKYFRLASTVPVDEIDDIEKGLAADELHPNKVKRSLARNIVAAYYDDDAALASEQHFDKVFKQHEAPDDVPVYEGEIETNDEGLVYLPGLMAQAKLAQSAGDARRLIDGGRGESRRVALPPKSYNVDPENLSGTTLQVGKRKFLRFE